MKPQQKAQKSSLEETVMPPVAEQGFNGLARSVECFDNQGFRNFRILTLHLVNGKVVKTEYSDPYASFEAISRMEMANELAIHHLNNNWKAGLALSR
jgi:hypothetical protein